MDRKRIHDEVIEILSHKLHSLPPLGSDDSFDYEGQILVPDITKDPLDIAEVSMDLEDAFSFNFDAAMPGEAGLETLGKLIDHIHQALHSRSAPAAAE